MKQPLRNMAMVVIIFTALLAPVLLVRAAGYGLDDAAKSAKILPTSILNKQSLPEAVGAIVSGFLGLLGIAFFGIVLYAGFTWMTALGNSEKVDKAKSMIEGALIGLIIVLLAYALTKFIFDYFDTNSSASQTTTSNQCSTYSTENACYGGAGCAWNPGAGLCDIAGAVGTCASNLTEGGCYNAGCAWDPGNGVCQNKP